MVWQLHCSDNNAMILIGVIRFRLGIGRTCDKLNPEYSLKALIFLNLNERQ